MADAMIEQHKRRPPASWLRRWGDNRLEVRCSGPGVNLRVYGTDEQVWEAVELFEKWTGLEVQCDQRPRRKVVPPAGQLSITELESSGNE